MTLEWIRRETQLGTQTAAVESTEAFSGQAGQSAAKSLQSHRHGVFEKHSPRSRRPLPRRPRHSLPAPGRCLAVAGLLSLHYALAARSLLQENPTVDEVVHLPAGVTYWQKGTFRLYHHNPPLFKLVAALPVVLAGAGDRAALRDDELDSRKTLRRPHSPNRSHCLNSKRYFELFQLARLMMPLFSIVGGSGRLRVVAPALRTLGRAC